MGVCRLCLNPLLRSRYTPEVKGFAWATGKNYGKGNAEACPFYLHQEKVRKR